MSREDVMMTLRFKGGPGSGHHGHAGRPGMIGGSTSGKGTAAISVPKYTTVSSMKKYHPLVYDQMKKLTTRSSLIINRNYKPTDEEKKQLASAEYMINDLQGKKLGDVLSKKQIIDYAKRTYTEKDEQVNFAKYVAGWDALSEFTTATKFGWQNRALAKVYGSIGKDARVIMDKMILGESELLIEGNPIPVRNDWGTDYGKDWMQ